MATTTSPTLDIVRRIVGRRHRITREEMRDILAALQNAGLDLRNGYVQGTLDLAAPWSETDGHPVSATAAEAWAKACKGITVICVSWNGLRDGYVRYDQPGSMHPQQHSELIFASQALAESEYDPIGYLRQRADRVLIVQD